MTGDQLAVFTERSAVVERIRSAIDAAEREVSLSIPAEAYEEFADALERAVDRGALVLLLVYETDDESVAIPDQKLDGRATVVRRSADRTGMSCTTDFVRGVTGHAWVFDEDHNDKRATAFVNENLAHAVFGEFLANYWALAREVFAIDPDPLPHTYEDFRHAVVQATLRLRRDERIGARAAARHVESEGPREEVRGEVVNARQSMIYPITSSFPVENNLVFRIGDRKVDVGGRGAFLEDYEAYEVTFFEADADRPPGSTTADAF